MSIFSIEFIIFLLITFTIFYVVHFINSRFKKVHIPQWSILLIASIVFYGMVNYVYLIYLGISVFISYVVGVLCQHKLFKKVSEPNSNTIVYYFSPVFVESHLERRKYENIITTIAIIVNVGILAFLKYFNFFADSVNSVFRLNLVTRDFIIPLGISFYTFSLIAYNVDCNKRLIKAETNPLRFLLFVSYFPKILQGPISSYDKLKEDGLFSEHDIKENDYLKAFFRISVGLIKKIAIANVLNLYVNATYSHITESYGGGLLLTSLLYTIQLYCDFSGFADITIGVSGLFGIKLEENFNIPYISASIQEFWRRWHITLGNWLKKYVYIPLGGNRVPIWRWVINTLIVWLVSGLWHGANWTFVVWGLFHGILLVASGLSRQINKNNKSKQQEEKKKALPIYLLSIICTFLLVNFGWIFFRSNSIGQAGQFYSHLVRFWIPSSYSMFSDSTISQGNWLFVVSLLLVLLLISLRTIMAFEDRIFKTHRMILKVSQYAVTIAFFSFSLFVFLYLNSIGGGESSFIYFDF